jgi:hypothetical protein
VCLIDSDFAFDNFGFAGSTPIASLFILVN